VEAVAVEQLQVVMVQEQSVADLVEMEEPEVVVETVEEVFY
jgi:hypothetical protein